MPGLTRWFRSFKLTSAKTTVPTLPQPWKLSESPIVVQNEAQLGLSSTAFKKHSLPPIALSGSLDIYATQKNSLLMTKLPIELRDAVWELAVGHYTVHMYWHDRDTLRGFACEQQSKCISMAHDENRGRSLAWGTASHIDQARINEYKGFMPLLLSCRAIYFEATRVLYSTTYFDFTDHWPAFQYLPWSISLSSISYIARINMVCHGVPLQTRTADFASWKKMWDTLALIRNLRNLCVEIVPEKGSNASPVTRAQLSDAEDELLEPVGKLRELVRGCEKGVWILKLPCEENVWGRCVARELEQDGWKMQRI